MCDLLPFSGPVIMRVPAQPLGAADYTAPPIHLRSLPSAQTVYDAAGTQRAQTTYEYDNYNLDANHAPLTDRPGISGLDGAFTTNYLTRGNITAVSRWLNTTGGLLITYQQYDIAGNVVKRIDARGFATTFDYSDRFGAPDGNARLNTTPPELVTQSAFAFPTRLDWSRISPNSMAEAGHACWQAVLTSPSRISRPASRASILTRLILCVQ